MTVPSKKLVLQQKSRSEEIERIAFRLQERGLNSLNPQIIQARLDLVNHVWREARNTNLDLLSRGDDEARKYVTEEIFYQMERTYEIAHDEIVAILSTLTIPLEINRTTSNSPSDLDSNEPIAKLPKLDLPKFSGLHQDWENFCDLFSSLVHNSSRLSDATKFQYLKSCLTGSAADLVKDVPITNANYSPTWKALKSRYFNPCLIVNNYLNELLDLPPMKTESAIELRALIDKTQCSVRALTSLKLPVGHWNIWLIHILSKKLDPESRKLWESEVSIKVRKAALATSSTRTEDSCTMDYFKTYSEFSEFLEQRSQTLFMMANNSRENTNVPSAGKPLKSSKGSFHSNLSSNLKVKELKCPLCLQKHNLWSCDKFLTMSPYERRDTARRLRLCFLCLTPHDFRSCTSTRFCSKCRGRHNTLLHTGTKPVEVPVSQDAESRTHVEASQDAESKQNVQALNANISALQSPVLLTTAQIEIIGPSGTRCRVRALLDQCSESSFISESIVQLLNLERQKVQIQLTGLGASDAGVAKSSIHLSLSSIYNPQCEFETVALILPKLTSRLPSKEVIDLDPALLFGFSLADPNFLKPASVDVILGSDIFGQLLKPGLKLLSPSKLIAQDTALGWIISGPTQFNSPLQANISQAQCFNIQCISDETLQKSLQKFWEIEELHPHKFTPNAEEEACEQLFQNTYSRNPDGKYVVHLPLKSEIPNVSTETRSQALKSLKSIHNKFERDPELAEAYRNFMKAYEDLGHMKKAPPNELLNSPAWYIPHHPVIQESQSKRKLRVVFDASRRTSKQLCLNDFLMPGPPLQTDISLILMNWRKHKYVFTADMVKMFRQILIHSNHQDLQRILWSPIANETPVEYRLKTVTYGTACAPFLAMRTMVQLAQDEQSRFPLGARCIQQNTYVDDIYAGSFDLLIAKQKRDELINLLRSSGIDLDKWSANHSELIPCQSPQGIDYHITSKSIDQDKTVKTLGIQWNPVSDEFSFQISDDFISTSNTKRKILASISRLFDPLGWLSPIPITAKILMQDLWILKYDWDSLLPPEVLGRWSNYCQSLSRITNISIKRWLGDCNSSRYELHAFSDASNRAYAVAVYLKVKFENGDSQVSLLLAKTKISPVKTISIPNLELMGATLLVKSINYIQKLDFLKNISVFAWTDSQIVLCWLRKHPCSWKTFVANRVSYIQTELPSSEWRYVATKDNPADLATRGVKPCDLKKSDLWCHGPLWLSSANEFWPDQPKVQTLHVEKQKKDTELLVRFSTLTRLIRVITYCIRFFKNLQLSRNGELPNRSFLSSAELYDARCSLIRLAQTEVYKEEMSFLTNSETRYNALPKSNPLQKMNPFIDDKDGILRVGGRLTHSSLLRDAKYPPILPFQSPLSRLFAHSAHLSSLHGGPNLTLSILQQHVWIPGSKKLVKGVIRSCTVCQHVKPTLPYQLMGDLPAARVTPSRPFTSTGLDYAGPFEIRATKGRGHRSYKGYIALFICFATRAIHLEAVSDLTSAAFLSAFRRFSGRRGVPNTIYSDNGTTFQGAERELREMFDASSNFYAEVATVLANEQITWSFIPPNAPYCGGLWEAGVKSTKHHLKRVLGDHTLTFEEFSTLLVQIEVCLNSRPLYPMSGDHEDINVLTPAHFLMGSASGLIPDSEPPNAPENRLNRYQLLQRIQSHFWGRWSREYLHHLQQRSKWRNPTENFAVGQLVLIHDNRYPPSKWPLGRIVETHPGTDGLIRVVSIKTANRTLRRHITRLSPLILPSSNENLNSQT